tara:strand:+ start:5169 stop:5468 length:300 start_codon:yes stop_codon:yes gene_type:complete
MILKKSEIQFLFKLIDNDFNQYGNQIRMGQSVMNNLRTLDYSLYLKLTESVIDPFYIEDNIRPALTSISEPDVLSNEILRCYNKDITNSIFKLKLKKLL